MGFVSTRPGRIDRAIQLGYMTNTCKERMARRILDEYPEALSSVLREIEEHPDAEETPAQYLGEACASPSAYFWMEKQREQRELTDASTQEEVHDGHQATIPGA